LKITFLGTGTSHGVPMIGCDCATCRSDDPRDDRLRPSVLVESDAGDAILVDAGPDLRAQALRFGVRRVDAVVFTHGHADHILGLDEIRRYNAIQKRAMPLYGDAPTLVDIERMFAYVFDPATPRGGGLPQLELRRIDGPFTVGSQPVVPVPIMHGQRPILGLRMGGFAYLTDCSRVPDESWPLLEGLDVLVLDALRDKPHPTHFTLAEAVDAAHRVGARRTWFTHMCHDLPHAATCDRLPDGMALAHDGLVVHVPADRSAAGEPTGTPHAAGAGRP
jgi:phosphoribosyl 1,2-cyclic phosphate phosphodiesterase